jgi:hypothetical protein
MSPRVRYPSLFLLIAGFCQPWAAEAQSRTEVIGTCGSAICIKTGDGNWQYKAADYCDSEVCLRDSFESIAALNWDRMADGQEDLIVADENPFVGFTDAEYRQLRDYGDDNLDERLQLLANVGVSCEVSSFSLRLNTPGRDIVIVTFGATVDREVGNQEFQVVSIDRTFRDLPGGSMGWWIRLVSHRYPGIERMVGEPTAFANYETGLYISRLVLLDIEFEYGTAAELSSHPDCLSR